MLALAGAHRSGKTTLARAMAQELGVPFCETKVGDVFADLGLDPKANLAFDLRLQVQDAILGRLVDHYESFGGKPFIADRSPLDVYAYTLADVQRHTLTRANRHLMDQHAISVGITLETHMRGLLLIEPLFDAEETPGKAQSCLFYMDHLFLLMRGFMSGMRQNGSSIETAVITGDDFDDRLAQGLEFYKTLRG